MTNELGCHLPNRGRTLGRRIFWKGIGISERSWEMGALAAVAGAAQAASLYSWRLSSKERFRDTYVKGRSS